MIRLPERSVTRFFIPLIDVLLLLFCIYLLMPLAEGTPAEPNHPVAVIDQARKAKADLERLRKEEQEATQKLAALRQEKTHLLHERLAIKVLDIDPRTGKLLTFTDRGERVDLRTAEDAQRLIQKHKQEVGNRELYYLFLFPRQETGFPERRQREEYERWFAAVPHGRDDPRGGGR